MTKITTKLLKRDLLGRKTNRLRNSGIIPVNIFGKNLKSLSAQILSSEFAKLFNKAGETNIIYVTIDGESQERPCLISSVQYHPITDAIIHVDFHQVNLKEKVNADVPVELTGIAPAIANENAAIITQIQSISVEALPTDLPEKFVIDLSALEKVGDHISVSNLSYDKSKITIEIDPDTIIVIAQAQQAEEPAPIPEAVAETPSVPGEPTPVAPTTTDQETPSK